MGGRDRCGWLVLATMLGAAGCGSEDPAEVPNPLGDPADGPPAGNPNPEATCDVPAEAGLADVSNPTTVVGTGTPESCTSDAVVDAVAGGGVILFDCGPDPVTITLEEPPGSSTTPALRS